MGDYLNEIKEKFHYSDEQIELIYNMISAFNEVLGEKYIDRIKNVFKDVYIFSYENHEEVSQKVTNYYNNGKKYDIRPCAGFTEDEIEMQNGLPKLNLVIGYKKGEISSLIHEICHALSYNLPEIENNTIKLKTGLCESTYQFVENQKGKLLKDSGNLFNEALTDNIALQVYDSFDKSKKHSLDDGYKGVSRPIQGIFNDDRVNRLIIDSYMNNNYGFIESIGDLISQEKYEAIIADVYNYVDRNDKHITDLLGRFSQMSFGEFFREYIEQINSYLKHDPNYSYKEKSLIMKIYNEIPYEVSDELAKQSSAR